MDAASCGLKYFSLGQLFGEGATQSSRNIAASARTPQFSFPDRGQRSSAPKSGSAERAISRRSWAPRAVILAFTWSARVCYILSVQKTKPSIEICQRKMPLCFFLAVHVRHEEETDAPGGGWRCVHVFALVRAAWLHDAPPPPRGIPTSAAAAVVVGARRRAARVQERRGCERRRGHTGEGICTKKMASN